VNKQYFLSTLLFCLIYIFCGVSYAAEKKVLDKDAKKQIINSISLAANAKAPFSGRLLKESIVISMLADIKFGKLQCAMQLKHTEEICNKKVEYAKLYCDKTVKYTKEDLQLELKYQKDRYENIIKIKNTQIDSLEKIAVEAPKSLLAKLRDSSFWFGIGVGIVTGVIVTGVVVYGVSK